VRVARAAGATAYRIEGPESIRPQWLHEDAVVGVTAGASAPEASVQQVIARLAPRRGVEVVRAGAEDEYFPPPPQLRAMLLALQSVIEGGLGARRPARPGPLDDDRSWSAARALAVLSAG
jgi:4-hydroxy-3-methylbut-2-enyl diphosphate reductase